MGTLVFNMIVATLYIIIFLCLKKYCSKDAKDKAQRLISRRVSLAPVRHQKHLENMIIKDIYLDLNL
jgi:hypothetical protein